MESMNEILDKNCYLTWPSDIVILYRNDEPVNVIKTRVKKIA